MSSSPKVALHVIDDAAAMAKAAAEQIVATAQQNAPRRTTIMLAGGSTPKAVYGILRDEYSSVVRDNLELFLGDVRMVPDDHKDSNYAMVRDSLLLKKKGCGKSEEGDAYIIDLAHVHPVNVGLPPKEAAADYEATIRRFFKDAVGDEEAVPSFDIVMLGFGPDGHTASLFPLTPAPLVTYPTLVTDCMPTSTVNPLVHRVTITRTLIANAKCVMCLARGADKRWVLDAIVEAAGEKRNARASSNGNASGAVCDEGSAEGVYASTKLPVAASVLREAKHNVVLYVDSAAAPVVAPETACC